MNAWGENRRLLLLDDSTILMIPRKMPLCQNKPIPRSIMIQCTWCSATTRLGPLHENLPIGPHSELFSTYDATTARTIDPMGAFWVGERCSTCAEAWNACFGMATASRNMGLPWPKQQLPFSLQPDWRTALPLTLLDNYMFVCLF
jgi:hypothetical protein